jgi:Tol biopolymer transport system component
VFHPGRIALTLLVAAVAVACNGGSNSNDGGTPQGSDGRGFLIYSRPDAIIEFDVATGQTKDLVRAGQANSFLLDPAVSLDGTQLAYVFQPPAQIIDGRYDAGTDLWVAARDGTGGRMVYQHTQPNALVRYPRWTPDGDIIAIIQEIDEQPTLTQVAYTVQRIDLETGARTKLLDDAYAITLAPDGSRMAYARPLMEGGGESFEAIALDGTGGDASVLVEPEANLLPFNSPEYSPDGESIAFASADQSLFPTPPPPPSPTGRLASPKRGPAADGLPQDLWLVDAEGGRPRLVATLKEDLPSLTWGGDGDEIYVLGGTGLYEVDVGNGALTRIGEGVFHGQIDWTAR